MSLEKISALAGNKNVTIFAQPPAGSGVPAFVALALSQISIPSPSRVAFNLSEQEVLQRRWSMVRNPLERIVAQNRVQEPKTLTVTGMLSADPVFSPSALLGVARLDRLELTKLINIIEASTCFVVTPERAYPNMGCTQMSETYDEDTGRGVRLSMTFEQFEIAIPGVVTPDFDIAASELGALEASDLGSTTPSTVTDLGGP